MANVLKNIGKVLGVILAAFVALLLVGNMVKLLVYTEYFSVSEKLCRNPGLNDGFVCQGICVSEEEDIILVSGYMKDKSNSRIYVTDFESNSYYVELTREGEKYAGHAGGIALTGDRVYISNASKLFVFSLRDLLATEAGGKFDIGGGVKVGCAASFVYADENYVYVGEYNDPNDEQKEHIYETPNGTNHSIIERYTHDDLENPDKVYSIGDYVQGVCFTPDGRIVFSTSHGFTSTVYYVYDEGEANDSGNTLRGAPVYYLGECERTLMAPAMGEDLDWYNGRIITLSECASDKYILGKFFFDYYVVSLDFGE